jgi:hypothetical protein
VRTLSWEAEEAWRSNPAAQRFEALVALTHVAETNPSRLALPSRPRNPRPGVWATDAGEYIVPTPEDAQHLGDTYIDVVAGQTRVFRRVNGERWATLSRKLADPAPIRAALVALFSEELIARCESQTVAA